MPVSPSREDKYYGDYVIGCYYGELNALRNLRDAAMVRATGSDDASASQSESDKLEIDELQCEIAELEQRLVQWGYDPELSQAASVAVPVQVPLALTLSNS
jgi:hypothetical protein